MRRRRATRLKRWMWTTLLVCALGAIWLDLTVRADATPLSSEHNNDVSTVPVKIVNTGATWYGKPIFSATNETSSRVLNGLAIRSWNQDLLPVIAEGRTKPDAWPHSSKELLKPPYQLQPHETMWFIGPIHSSAKFYIFWTQDGRPVHEVLTPAEPS